MKSIYKLKISIKESTPKIFRKFLIPENTNLVVLHKTIQVVMGWENNNLYSFNIKGKNYTSSTSDFWVDYDKGLDNNENVYLNELGLDENSKFTYIYDFRDNWEHELILEKILDYNLEKQYPYCIEGSMKCPFEDSGGISEYKEIVEILNNPEHEEYEETKEDYLGDLKWDSTEFNINEINSKLKNLNIFFN